MPITGPLGSIGPIRGRGTMAMVSFQRDYSQPIDLKTECTVHMCFRAQVDRLAMLNPGDRLELIGQIARVDPFVLYLDPCEFVDST